MAREQKAKRLARIATVETVAGVSLCHVQFTHAGGVSDQPIPVSRSAPGVMEVPESGTMVVVDYLEDGTPFISDVLSQADFPMPDLPQGSYSRRFNDNTHQTFEKTGTDSWTQTLSNNGYGFRITPDGHIQFYAASFDINTSGDRIPSTTGDTDGDSSDGSGGGDSGGDGSGGGGGLVYEDDLAFDTATQNELDSHAEDTTNPHGVTDEQTGAADALSSHAGDADAHHARYTAEEVRDVVNTLIQAGSLLTANYDDTADTLTLDVDFDPATKADANHDHDGRYSQLGHAHDDLYAALGHDHDADYAASGHGHTEYTKTDGSRPFTNPVGGVKPQAQTDLVTKDYVDGLSQGLEYQESALDYIDTPPTSPAAGDRYLVSENATDEWAGYENHIAEYGSDGTWSYTSPDEGWSIYLEDCDCLRVYNNVSWVLFGSTIEHSTLQSLSTDDHSQYLHVDGRRDVDGDLTVNGTLSVGADTVWHAGTFDPTTKADAGHNHDDQYAALGHNHDTEYVATAHADDASAHHEKYTDSEAVTAVNAETLLDVDISGDAATVDGRSADDLARPRNVAQLTTTDTTDINQSSWVAVPWTTELTMDAGYGHPANASVTVDTAGTYRVHAMVSFNASTYRVNPGISFAVNGTRRDRISMGGYIRNSDGHREATTGLTELIDLNAGDALSVHSTQMGNTGTCNLRPSESIFIIEQVSETVPRSEDADTVDGYHATDLTKGGYEIQKNGTDGPGIINFKT